jgi:hypothetical protein
MSSRFKDARVLSHSFVPAKSSQCGEGRIDVSDSPTSVGDDNSIRRLVNSRDQTRLVDILTFLVHQLPEMQQHR